MPIIFRRSAFPSILIPSSGLGPGPGAPTNAQILLSGQTGQEQSTYQGNPPNDFLPQAQNSLTIGFSAATLGAYPIASYNVYRDVNKTGTYSLYDSISASSSATIYSNYVTASGTLTPGSGGQSGPYPYQTSVNHAYTDTLATTCIGYPAGSGPDYYQGNGYSYKVSAVDNQGQEGPLSASSILVYYQNGLQINTAGDFNSNMTTNYTATDGGVHGTNTMAAKLVTTTTTNGIWAPYAGYGTVHWNINTRAFNYLYMDVKAGQSGSDLKFLCLRVSDVAIQNSGGGQLVTFASNYAALVNGSYVTIKIPLTDILLDWTSGSPVLQTGFYKFGAQDQTGLNGAIYWIDNVYFGTT